MAYNAAPPPAVHFDPRCIHDWEIAKDGQWFLGILHTPSGLAQFVPSYVAPRPKAGQAGVNLSHTASKLEAKAAKLPTTDWHTIPAELREGINKMSREEWKAWKEENHPEMPQGLPGAQAHMRLIDYFNLNVDECLGFSLVKRVGTSFACFGERVRAIYIDKSNSVNQSIAKAGTRANPDGGRHMPIAWNQSFLAAFSTATDIPVEDIDISECAHETHVNAV